MSEKKADYSVGSIAFGPVIGFREGLERFGAVEGFDKRHGHGSEPIEVAPPSEAMREMAEETQHWREMARYWEAKAAELSGQTIGQLSEALEEAKGRLREAQDEVERLKHDAEERERVVRRLSDERIKAQRKAQEALDNPNHVWANQRRQLRAQRRDMDASIGHLYYRCLSAERCLSAVLKGMPVERWQVHNLPGDLLAAVKAYNEALETVRKGGGNA